MAPVKTVETIEAERAEIAARIEALDKQFEGQTMSEEARADWNALNAEHDSLGPLLEELRTRRTRVTKLLADEDRSETSGRKFDSAPHFSTRKVEDLWDLDAYRSISGSPDEYLRNVRDGAMRALEESEFPQDGMDVARTQAHIAKLLKTIDHADPASGKVGGELARRIIGTGSPVYQRAFDKVLRGYPLDPDEQRALSVGTGSAGGFAVVYTLDPTIVPTSNFSVNPIRAIARKEQIAGTNEWKAVTSGAITAAYAGEATEASDNAPTLAQPDIIVERAQAYVPFSIEIGQDWGALQQEMASLLQDAKDDLEATKFLLGAGHGSTEPKGIMTAATNTTTAGGTAAFAIADLYKVFEALAPRFRPRAVWAGNLFTYDKVRQFDTAGGSGVWVDATSVPDLRGLGPGVGGQALGTAPTIDSMAVPKLLGRNAVEATAMASALTTGSKILLIGDFRYFVVVDRIGMNIEIVPLVVGTNHRPTGQRGMYAYWRNSSDALSAAAFQVLVTG